MSLSQQATNEIQKYYRDKLKKYGKDSPQGLDWNSEYTQKIRFYVLSQLAKFENQSILDVGCGVGDLYGFLKKKVKNFTYTGIDLVPEMIKNAKKKFPEGNFKVHDFSQDLKQTYDFVLASGVLSFKIKNYKKIYFDMITRMFNIAKKAVAFNALDFTKHPNDLIYAPHSPTEIYKHCTKLTDKLILRHDYLSYDFTIYMYKPQHKSETSK